MKKLFLLFAMVAFFATGCENLMPYLDQLQPEDPPQIEEITVDLTTPDATLTEIPNNQIWYVATEQIAYDFKTNQIESNNYDPKTGKGVITFIEELTTLEEGAFFGSQTLLSITLPSSITAIAEGAFANCTSLKSVVIPEGINTIGKNAFLGCSALQKVTIGYDVTEIGDFAFNGCESLEAVYMMCKSAPKIASEAFNGELLKIYVDTDQVETYKGHEQWSAYEANITGYDYPTLMTLINLCDSISDPELKMGTYREDFFTFLYVKPCGTVVDVEVYERALYKNLGVDGIYYLKNIFSLENVIKMLGGTPSDMVFSAEDIYIEVNASDPENVYIPYQYAGIGITDFMDQVYIASGREIGKPDANLVDGIITFPDSTVGILGQTGGYITNQSGAMRISLPGAYIPDYSISVSYTGMEGNQALFNFELGKDVAEYRFVVVEGNQPIFNEVKEGTVPNQTTRIYLNEAIENMVNSGIYDICSPASQTEWRVSLPNAAVYTIFAVAYNSNGEPMLTNINEYDNIAIAHFYFRPEGCEDAIPDIHPETLTIQIGSVGDILGDQYNTDYPEYSYLIVYFTSKEDYIDDVTELKIYFDTTANIEQAKSDGTTMEELFASENAKNITDRIVYIKKDGSDGYLCTDLTPETSYTAIIEVLSIYGKKYYYEVTGSTSPYYEQSLTEIKILERVPNAEHPLIL